MKNAADMLSICITLKNRSALKIQQGQVLHLFPNCIDSIIRSIRPDDNIEIIVSDWESTDWPVQEWTSKKLADIPLKVIKVSGAFHRGTGRNVAANAATGKYLLFLDADMILCREVILNGLEKVKRGIAYYPICFYFLNPSHSLGFWCGGGRGNVMMTKEMFLKASQWPCPPRYRRHADEDQVFHRQVIRAGIQFELQREPGFFHQYHPGKSVDTILSKRRFLIEKFTQTPIEECRK